MISWLWEADSLRFYFFPSTLFFALLLCFYTLVLSTQYYTHLQRTHTNIGIFFSSNGVNGYNAEQSIQVV